MYVCVLGFDVYLWSAGWDEIHTCWRFSSQTLRNLSPPHFGLSLAVRFSGILFPPLCSVCFLSPTFMLIYFSLLHWVLRQILFPQRCDLSLFITSYRTLFDLSLFSRCSFLIIISFLGLTLASLVTLSAVLLLLYIPLQLQNNWSCCWNPSWC